jgi:hypothetical protein
VASNLSTQAAIDTIDEQAWTPVEYPDAVCGLFEVRRG